MMARIMKAIRVKKFGGPQVLQLENVEIPPLSSDQLLIRIKSAGVNPVDTYIREGAFSGLPDLPFTPGKDGAGIVEAIGENVTGYQLGQRVFVYGRNLGKYGTYAEYAVVQPKNVYPLDEKLTFDQGAAIGIPYFTAYRALIMKAHAVANETVLVHGASGACGLAAIQIAKAYNMKVFGTAGTKDGMAVVEKNGADHVLCHKDKGYLDKIMDLTNGKGVDVVIEMLSNVNLGKDLEILAPKGRVSIVGCRGSVKIEPRLMMGPETTIVGVALLNSTEEEMKEISSAILKGIREDWVVPVIDKVYQLDEAATAHHDVIHSKGAKGKLVLSVASS